MPETEKLAEKLKENYKVPVMPINIEAMQERDMYNILKEALYEFPVSQISIQLPSWVEVLDKNSEDYKEGWFLEDRDILKIFNNTIEFENKKYLNVINPTFKCYTNYFTDDEQSKLWHLFESTLVYLHDLNSGEILPVNIKNNKVDYTTFTNNGKKKFYNIIELEVAQERIRK